MLRRLRITVASVFFLSLLFIFLDFTGISHPWLGWMAKFQFIPALLAVNIAIIAGLTVLTLLFGRIYCSVICPLGVFQDIISRLALKFRKKRFHYSPALHWLRYSVLAVFVLSFLTGLAWLFALLEPYSIFGRITSTLIAPQYQQANNILAHFAEKWNSYAFYSTGIWIKSLTTIIIASASLLVIIVLAWRGGRTYCNTICPVGTFLGFISRYSLYKPVIDTSKCNSCGLCSRNCKASCINSQTHTIDYSRCVTCFNCIDTCKKDALKYVPAIKTKAIEVKPETLSHPSGNNSDTARRNFLSIAALLAATAALRAQHKVDGGLAAIEDKKIPNRQTALSPAGSVGLSNLSKHCTACQLCISACPNEVLRPSGNLESLMQPEMWYERGYCRPECVKCAAVCPTGAIHPISVAEKSSIQIGHAVWIRKNCVVTADKVSCGNCARHCPVNAIFMVSLNASDPESLQIPVVNTERCIGCGACENLCPSRPFSAIYVEGHERHRVI